MSKYTTIGVFYDTKKQLDKKIFLESARIGEKITYDEYIRKLIKVKKQKC
jgi:hypothetical protein